jgi:hypothetical protein
LALKFGKIATVMFLIGGAAVAALDYLAPG